MCGVLLCVCMCSVNGVFVFGGVCECCVCVVFGVCVVCVCGVCVVCVCGVCV